MDRLAQAIGRVMMGVTSKREDVTALRSWADIEYSRDKEYAYQMLLSGKKPDCV